MSPFFVISLLTTEFLLPNKAYLEEVFLRYLYKLKLWYNYHAFINHEAFSECFFPQALLTAAEVKKKKHTVQMTCTAPSFNAPSQLINATDRFGVL